MKDMELSTQNSRGYEIPHPEFGVFKKNILIFDKFLKILSDLTKNNEFVERRSLF